MAERMVKVETKIESISNKLDRHAHEQREDFDKVLKKLDSLDSKFASKWVEKAIFGLLFSFVTMIITLLFKAVFA